MTDPIRIRVLGRIALEDPPLDRSLGRGRARELLALLVAAGPTPTPTTAIVDALWPDEPPATAATIVHGLVRRLRTLLGTTAIVSEPTGYRLAVPTGSVDLWRIVEAAERGDVRHVRAEWVDPAFGAYADREWARQALARLPRIQRLVTGSTIEERTRPAAPVGRLIGRRSELARVTAALERSRLVSIVGLGGVGKTRLAAEVASRSRSGGAVRVDVAASTGPVAGRIVAGLELEQSGDPGRDRRTAASAIGTRALLIILDGCEHEPEETAAAIEHLLATCPRLRVLVTSRTALGAVGEHIVPLLPFAAPASPHGDSVALLLDRAAALGIPIEQLDRRRLAALCTRTAGVPLAIELMVTEVAFPTPDLDVTGAAVDSVEPRRPAEMLRAIVVRSVDDITPGAATVIHRAARLVDGMGPTVLRALCDPRTSAPGIRHELHATGLLGTLPSDRSRRLRLPDPVRLVLLERPDAGALRGAAEAIRIALTTARPTLEEPVILSALDPAIAELGNTEALIDSLVEAGDHEMALRLVRAGADAWSESGAWQRGAAIADPVLDRTRPDGSWTPPGTDEGRAPVDPLVWAGAVWGRAIVRATYASSRSDYPRMLRAADIAARAPDPALEAHLQHLLALGAGYGGDVAAATEHRRRLHHLVDELDSDYGRAIARQLDALGLLMAGEAAASARALETAAIRTETLGAIADAARAHRLAGLAHGMAGDTVGAHRSLRRAEALAIEAGARGSLATILTDLVDLRRRTGDLDRGDVVDALGATLGIGNLRAAGILRIRLGVIDRDPAMLATAALDLLESDRIRAAVALTELHSHLPAEDPARAPLVSAAAALRASWGAPLGPEDGERVERLCAGADTVVATWDHVAEARLRSLLADIGHGQVPTDGRVSFPAGDAGNETDRRDPQPV